MTDAARAAPSSRDWRTEIETVARGQALDAALQDVENYASLPAHTVGAISRDPSVTDVQPNRVMILDCVDLGDSRLIADTTGEVLDDLENRAERFRLRAEVVADGSAGWRVTRTSPALDESC
ncbi:hypothetical protein [Pseudonocardia nigra]|uniref:hypothetical protein n=1 Tax=Pseudonocardia nigra TaxID=1921578 RepID=UPI001C5D7196|nr:hypothetical protein [Pseudonocardia nigra]